MKVYLVGGAVRDQCLGYPVVERDWVVVGSSPDELLRQGYQQVGKDFPVFLHPQTHEEYALARTERKLSAGYYGFACDYSPTVSLEDDLIRRDLTINAMAMDDQGQLIDPFHGLEDLRFKRLRHVSPAFIEDPVRVLRVARFAARYHHLGFRLADETRQLMVEMVKRGELSHLVPERVWQEWSRSLGERHPEQFIHVLRQCGALGVVIPELNHMFGIPQRDVSSGLNDSGLRAVEALTTMAQRTDDPVLRFAALLHNNANRCTRMASWPLHEHQPGQVQHCLQGLFKRLRIPKDYTYLARMTAECYHSIQQLIDLDAEAIVNLLEYCDAFRRPQGLNQMLFVCEAITVGLVHQSINDWRALRDRCAAINAQDFIEQGIQGDGIRQSLRQSRINSVNEWKSNHEA